MPERRATRFVVEALFLAALAAALAFARLEAIEIAGVMLVGWIVVAALEWAAWRGQPHYGSGLPPRYYIPGVNLPPPKPLEQVEQGYPGATREEAPTWIASAALRAEVLGAWPVAAPVELEEEAEDAEQAGEAEEPEEAELEFADDSEAGADPWTVAALPAEPLPPPESVPFEPAVPAGARTARYSLDPLAEPAPRRRFGRQPVTETIPTIEVPARPHGRRPLPRVYETRNGSTTEG